MKRLLSLALLMASLSMYAQTIHQEGFVRSVGRPENKNGVRLAGAILRVAGNHNKVQSDSLGQFDLVFDGKREGRDAFTFSSIYLSGYDIPENKIYGPYAISTTVPVELVLVPQSLKHELEERVRKQIEASYQKKLECIKAEKDRLGEEYAQKLEQLAAEYERSDILVNQIVNHYASLDYATMDSYKARLSILIENGELESADSLMRTVDVARLEADNLALREAARKMNNALTSNIEQLKTIYQGKADVFKLKFENDSAAFYMEKLVALDTTNVRNALATGIFLRDYCAQYDKSGDYFQLALRQNLLRYGETSIEVATCYYNIGKFNAKIGQYSSALKYFQQAMNIQLPILGENHHDVGATYNGMAVVLNNLGQYSQALECYQKVIKMLDENTSDLAIIYDNMGQLYFQLHEYPQALEFYQKGLKLSVSIFGDSHPHVAVTYNNMGNLYFQLHEYSQALEFYQKSLKIFVSIFGDNHPDVATAYNNMGNLYSELCEYPQALECLTKALTIQSTILGENHPCFAVTYGNMGNLYALRHEYLQALEFYQKSLDVLLSTFGENHPDVATIYLSIGMLYFRQHEYSKALDFYQKALEISLAVYGSNNLAVADCYDNIADCYYFQKEYTQVVDYLQNALRIRQGFSNHDNECRVVAYNNRIGMAYYFMGDNYHALVYYKKSLLLGLGVYGRKHSSIGHIFANMGAVYYSLGQYSEALENLQQSVDILSHFVDDSDSTLKGAKGLIVQIEQKTK